ncbi:MAG: hypothetical protein MUC83_17905 [Pirellula sp.]|jgi:rhamnosyltransferase|nr:hypothetical protein [Pirellula sp.]
MRALIYVHFDRDGIVDPHVEYALAQYRPHVDHLVFVSPSVKELSPQQKTLVDSFVPRENIGYDFGSWRDGLRSLDMDRFEEVLFANDSVYGPLWSPEPSLKFGRERDLDFWGMVMSDQSVSKKSSCRHIQSWFFAASKVVLHCDAFQQFWSSIENVDHKHEIIRRFEVGMSKAVTDEGFRIGALYESKCVLARRLALAIRETSVSSLSRSWRLIRRSFRDNRNPSEGDWESLLENNVPFVKVSLFKLNPYGRALSNVYRRLEQETNYDTKLIQEHLRRINR